MRSATADVVVIGAGLVGASVARRLADRGLGVTVVEARRPAGGTSLATFSWVNAVGKTPRPYFDLNLAGIAEHHRLAEELGGGEWLHPAGNLELSHRADELETKVATHREWGYAVESISVEEASRLEPHIAVGSATGAAIYPDDAWVDPAPLVGRLLDHPGITLRTGATVTGIAVRSGRVAEVALANGGGRISTERAVVCAGPRSGELVEGLGFTLPMRHAPGLLVWTEPAPVRIERILHAPGIAIRPDGAGRLLVASDGVDRRMETTGGELSVAEAIDELCRRATELVPRLAGVPVESHRIGLRALTADGKPAIGPVPGVEGAYVATMHSGITLAPLIGRLVAVELADGTRELQLEDYRPDRFADTAASA